MPRTGAFKIPKPIGDVNDSESMYYYLLRFTNDGKMLNLTDRTLETRSNCLCKFLRWCDDRGMGRPNQITKPILERYQRHLFLIRKPNGQPLSIAAQLSNLASVRAYFKWLAQKNHILYNPASDLQLPKMPKSLPKNILSASEVDLVLNQADISRAQGIRDRAMMEVLYSTGIRRMELSNLSISDINYNAGTLMVDQGKGKKDRLIPIGQRAIDWVLKYLYEVRPEWVIGDSGYYLFLSINGEALTPSWLSNLVTRYIKAADIGKTGSCHLFRHSMASMMMDNGADIRYIQTILGHASLETTQIYTHVSIGKLKEIHRATHPAKYKTNGKESSEPESQAHH